MTGNQRIDLHGKTHQDAAGIVIDAIEDNLHHSVKLTFIIGNSIKMEQIIKHIAIDYELIYSSLMQTEMTITTDDRKR